MASMEWMEQRVNSIMRQLRMEDKAKENLGTPNHPVGHGCPAQLHTFSYV